MPDIIGLIPLAIAAILLIKSNFLNYKTIRYSIAIGILIWLTFLFRRWYAYAGVSVLICTLINNLILNWLKNRSYKNLLRSLIPIAIAASSILTLLIIFQFDLMLRVAQTSYKDIYQAYQAPLHEHIIRLYNHSGPIFSTLAISGIILAVIKRQYHVLFFATVSLITFLLFSTTQAPGVQHGLPIYLFLMPAILLTIAIILNKLSTLPKRIISITIVSTILGIHLVSFSPKAYHCLPLFVAISPDKTYHPLHLQNYAEYQRLIADLHGKLDPGDTFSTFASSEILSDSLFHALDKSLDPHIAWVGHIDEVDGFRVNTLRARFSIVAEPTPVHEAISSQQVIIVPAAMILAHEGIGKDYRKVLGPYHLANAHIAYVYERITPLSDEMLHVLETALKRHHPEWLWDEKDRIYTPIK